MAVSSMHRASQGKETYHMCSAPRLRSNRGEALRQFWTDVRGEMGFGEWARMQPTSLPLASWAFLVESVWYNVEGA